MVARGVNPLILAPSTVLSALGASLSLGIARLGERQELLDAGAEFDSIRLTEQEQREMLG